jgi:hypothetical protein
VKNLVTTTVIVGLVAAGVGGIAGYAIAGESIDVHVELTRGSWVIGLFLALLIALGLLRLRSHKRFREAVTWLLFGYLALAALVLGDLALSLSSPAHNALETERAVHVFGTSSSLRNLDATTISLTFLLVLGALGGLVHVFWVFVGRTGGASFQERWVWWYLTGPFFGAAAAFALTLAVGEGLMSFGGRGVDATSTSDIGLLSFGAFVAGLFSKSVLSRLRRLLPEPQRTNKPTITSVSPEAIAPGAATGQAIELKGSGFSSSTVVYLEGSRVTPVTLEGDKLRFLVDVPTSPDRPISLNVVNETKAATPVLIDRR